MTFFSFLVYIANLDFCLMFSPFLKCSNLTQVCGLVEEIAKFFNVVEDSSVHFFFNTSFIAFVIFYLNGLQEVPKIMLIIRNISRYRERFLDKT